MMRASHTRLIPLMLCRLRSIRVFMASPGVHTACASIVRTSPDKGSIRTKAHCASMMEGRKLGEFGMVFSVSCSGDSRRWERLR
jgi:hypothetical protein